MNRRDFLYLSIKSALAIGGASILPRHVIKKAHAYAMNSSVGPLSDPILQPKFVNYVPNALDPSFHFDFKKGRAKIGVGQTQQATGLVDAGGNPLYTTVWGYGTPKNGYTWPGRTIVAYKNKPLKIRWENRLLDEYDTPLPHLLPVDTSFHWCYSLHGYEGYSLENTGVPIVTHLHGGHSDSPYDGNPEYFISPGYNVRGPRWVEKDYIYHNDQPAGTLWYHDHALGITRLNVYAGLAGFYILRDEYDTGDENNAWNLPSYPYELAYAIQDRMFDSNGQLFYPGWPDDPFWDDFITGEGVVNPPMPSGLAEFFGDHMLVNGILWPKADVEPRRYRVRLLNGCDSRFLVVRLRPVNAGDTDLTTAGAPMPFTVIGTDQGMLSNAASMVDLLIMGPGERYDVLVDFSDVSFGSRVIIENFGGDAPFGGYVPDLDPDDLFPDRQTDRIMAFDVVQPLNSSVPDQTPVLSFPAHQTPPVDRVRKLALFEGQDEYGRLQPMLGTAEPVTDVTGVLREGTMTWHMPITENPELDATEEWEIYNATGDSHPVHLHLVSFEVVDRQPFEAEAIEQSVEQHNGTIGTGFRLENIQLTGPATPAAQHEKGLKDVVTMNPGEVTRIRMTFDKPGRYVWHCHILSHEDHDMMRPLHVGPIEEET